MLARTISARKALTALTKQYNSYAASAAWYRCCDHDAGEKDATVATVLLEIATILFKDGKDYRLTSVSEKRGNGKVEWRKMEVI